MQFAAFCILLLAISEPLLVHAKKVVVFVPRQIRRSPVTSWRPSSMHYRKSSPSSDYYHPNYYGQMSHYREKKPFYKSPPFPHGGDDFDEGHEHVNHVHIPHGKEISHAISFGKGYVPYENIKGSFSFGRERHPTHSHSDPEYASTSYTSSGSEYPPSSYSYDPSQLNSYFSDSESSLDPRERRNDRKKIYSYRSVEKDLGLKTHVDLNSLRNEKEQLLQQHPTQIYNAILPSNQGLTTQGLTGSIVLPSGIPSPTLGGSKEGIVLRDTVALDEYQKRLQEITNSWPQFLTGGSTDGNSGYQHQQANVTPSFSSAGVPGSSITGSNSWLSGFAQPKQGYAVKEDTMEQPHDFRTMPIQTASFQSLPLTANVAVTPITQTIHG